MNGIVYGDEIENLFNTNNEIVMLTAANILKKCKFSKINSSGLETCFFTPSTDSVSYETMNMTEKDNGKLFKLSSSIKMPKLLETIYKLLDSYDREFTYNQFTFMSINEVIKRLENLKQSKQHYVCDIAFTYMMGNIIMLAYDLRNGVFFMRIDGGANDFDRLDNVTFITTYDTTTIPIVKQILPTTLFNTINRDNIDDYQPFFVN